MSRNKLNSFLRNVMRSTNTVALVICTTIPLSVYGEKSSEDNNQGLVANIQSNELSPKELFSKFQKLAEEGNAEAQTELGYMYFNGNGVQQNDTKAVELFQKAAEQGYAEAQTELSTMYHYGFGGLPIDQFKEFSWLQKAAIQGYAVAQNNLGVMYANGEGAVKDKVLAYAWYLLSTANNYNKQRLANIDALGKQMTDAERVEGKRLASNWKLGDTLQSKEDFAKLKEKAEVRDANSQHNLGVFYERGTGLPKDEVKVFQWYQKAAKQGVASSQYNIAIMYFEGKGVIKDTAKAINWLQKAAEQGYARAQGFLGLIYLMGVVVPKDALKAAKWLQKSAEQGDADAQSMLGILYANGDGVPKNEVISANWFKKGAIQGKANSQFLLGQMYFEGNGVQKNNVLAYAWINLAAAAGYKGAQTYRDMLESKLTAAEQTEGQQLATSWKEGDDLLVTSGNSFGAVSPKWNELRDTPPDLRKKEIINEKLNKQKTGTAFVVNSEGYALTNHHVVDDCSEIKVAGHDGVATVIASDSVNDLALLQLPIRSDSFAKLNPDLNKLRQGEDVIVFGYPLNYLLSSGGNLTLGTLSALTGLGNNTNQIQITAPIQPGSSGSPVMDKKGNIVAVVSMMLDDTKMTKATGQVGQNVNFAVNGQTVKAFLDVNKVSYKTGGGFFSHEMNNADIADEARKWTVLVECWK